MKKSDYICTSNLEISFSEIGKCFTPMPKSKINKQIQRAVDYPQIKMRKIDDGRMSLYLYYYYGKKRVVDNETGNVSYRSNYERVAMGLYIYTSPKTEWEKNHNEETLIEANIRRNKESDRLHANEYYRPKRQSSIDVISWMHKHCNDNQTQSKRVKLKAVDLFKEFIGDRMITPNEITKELGKEFASWLTKRTNGESPNTYFKRLHTIIRQGVEEKIFSNDPFLGVTAPEVDAGYRKEVLTADEVMRLIQCRYDGQNEVIRKYVIFALYTAIRYGDAKELTWGCIDTTNEILQFRQSKTRNQVKPIPLKKGLLEYLDMKRPGKRNEKVFPNLPSNVMINKALSRWTRHANINKHITSHCLRGTALTLMGRSGDYHIIADISGHKDERVLLTRYVQPLDERKKELVETYLPPIPNQQQPKNATQCTNTIDVSKLSQEEKERLILALFNANH